MWVKGIVGLLVVLVAGLLAGIFYGRARWKSGTEALRLQLEAARLPMQTPVYDAREIESLPAPVQRYFRAVLKDGQAIVKGVQIVHEGRFNRGETEAQWGPFTSTQQVITHRPGFDWDGRIRMAPGLSVFVHDAYVAGEGLLHASLLGLVTVADLRGTPEVAQGELLRFLAEAVWYPTALLPSQGVRWDAIDEASARATLTDGAVTVSLVFSFDAEGLVRTVRAEERYRSVQGTQVATPWEGRFWAYDVRDGLHIPLEGEVAWLLSAGPWPYWQGRITEISHTFAP